MNGYSSQTAQEADYVVVGTGSAGCVVAEGLSAEPRNEVAPLIEMLGPIVRPRGATEFGEETLQQALTDDSYTFYHPVGTCRMGSDPSSVVTPSLEVRGVHGLRVADASIMPTAIRGHTHAPSMVIGAKAVEFIGARIHD